MSKWFDFFYENACFGYYPNKETEEEGRVRGAKELEKAYIDYFADPELAISWVVDPDVRSSDWDDNSDYATWGAMLVNDEGEPLAALWEIDLGEDADPTTSKYAKVVEAELALEYYGSGE